MGSVFIYLNKGGSHPGEAIVKNAMPEMEKWGLDMSASWHSGVVSFACHKQTIRGDGKPEEGIVNCEKSGCTIVADSRIDYREELGSRLGLPGRALADFSDTRLILEAYLKFGQGCVDHLYGDFTFAIWDEKKAALFCARDHFGTRPLFYADCEDYLALSSEIATFRMIPGFALKVNEAHLSDLVYSIFRPNRETIFGQVRRLEPASCMSVSAREPLEIRSYWALKIQEEFMDLDEHQAIKGLKDRLIDAVDQRMPRSGRVGVELSGGLDSSAVAACMSTFQKAGIEVRAFSNGSGTGSNGAYRQVENETRYSESVAETLSLAAYEVIGEQPDKGVLEPLLELLRFRMIPEIQFFASLSDLLLDRVRESGIHVLFSGYGGDEGVSNSGYARLEELLARGKLRSFIFEQRMKVRYEGGSFLKQVAHRVLLLVFPYCFKWFRRLGLKDSISDYPLAKDVVKSLGQRKRYQAYWDRPRRPDTRFRQQKRIMHPHVADRLETSHFAGMAKKVEYRYPLLDVKLLEFYFSLPSEWKFKYGRSRYVFREAVNGLLPDQIRLRNDKSVFTIPNVFHRILMDEAELIRIIEDGRQKNGFHYFNYQRLRGIIEALKKSNKTWEAESWVPSLLTSVSILVLQEWQREGNADLGIKA